MAREDFKKRRVVSNRKLYYITTEILKAVAQECMEKGGQSPVAEPTAFPTREDDPGFDNAEKNYPVYLPEELR